MLVTKTINKTHRYIVIAHINKLQEVKQNKKSHFLHQTQQVQQACCNKVSATKYLQIYALFSVAPRYVHDEWPHEKQCRKVPKDSDNKLYILLQHCNSIIEAWQFVMISLLTDNNYFSHRCTVAATGGPLLDNYVK